ncbi:MAG TPA: P-loop NTPase fold protein [Allosphingosinicella sp.]|nr:P-loop NTPase fold protein [Allosphingosinicella sp.]
MLNEHVVRYLDEYLAKIEPRYAVLITGAWGSGKTFLLKNYFQESRGVGHLYVSLYGVASEQELRTRILATAYPLLESKKAKAFGSLARSALGIVGITTDLTADQLLEYDQYDTIILDDLERALLPTEAVLGFVNQLIEHGGKKVVLAASEDVLRSAHPKFKEIKEKTIGFTLAVRPDVGPALAALAERSPKALASTIKNNAGAIVELFQAVGTENLRVLAQALDDYGPLAEVFETDERIGKAFKSEALLLFLALDLAYKTGRIEREDLKGRQANPFNQVFERSGEATEEDRMDRLQAAVSVVDLHSRVLDSQYLESRICDGLHRPDYLARGIGDAAAISDPEANAEWRNVWWFMQNDEALTRASFSKMLDKFNARAFSDPGEILHVFGLLLEAAKLDLLRWSDARVLREGKAYLDDLDRSGNLLPLGEDFLGQFSHGAAHGLGFTNGRHPVFVELKRRYLSLSEAARVRDLQNEVREAAYTLANEPTKFTALVRRQDERRVDSMPILHILGAKTFAQSFMLCDAPAQFEIMSALGGRYGDNGHSEVLAVERKWLSELRRAIVSLLRGRERLTKTRINRLIAWNIDEAIDGSGEAGDQ